MLGSEFGNGEKDAQLRNECHRALDLRVLTK